MYGKREEKNPEHAKVGCKDLSLSIGSVSLEYCNNSWVKPLDDKTIEVDWADCADRPVDNVGTRYIVDLKDKTAIRSDTHSKKHFNPQKKKLFIYGWFFYFIKDEKNEKTKKNNKTI